MPFQSLNPSLSNATYSDYKSVIQITIGLPTVLMTHRTLKMRPFQRPLGGHLIITQLVDGLVATHVYYELFSRQNAIMEETNSIVRDGVISENTTGHVLN